MRFGPLILFLVITALVQTASADRPHNIFDDDWTPPKPATTTRPPAPAKPPTPPPADPPSKTAPDNTAQTPKETTTVSPVITPAPPARLAVPSSTAQAAVRKVMKEVFAAQLADRSIPARRKLTTALLEQVDKSADAPVDQFVLLAAAIDSAIDSANLPAACRAADKMSATFDIDGLGVKADAALRIGPKSTVSEQAAENVSAAIDLADALAQVDDYASAVRVCVALFPSTAANPVLKTQLQQRQRELTIAREVADRFVRDQARLNASPADPALNLSVGRYLCFVKNDWEIGLPLLAKSSDPLLKSSAIFELSKPITPEENAHLADNWWDTAAKQPDATSRANVTAHAAVFYARAIDNIAGLRKVQIEKRMADAANLATAHARPVREILIEAFIDGDTTLHVTAQGVYWKSHGAAKPGLLGSRDEPTYVNTVAWRPTWSDPRERGTDTSDIFPLKVGPTLELQAEVVGCADKPGTDRIDSRDPIHSEVVGEEFVVTIPDRQSGAKWYGLRIFRKP
jgi:hypothetical protein